LLLSGFGLSWQRVYGIFLKATVLAVILTIPPIVGLFLMWRCGERTALSTSLWMIGTVFWNIVVLVLFIRGKLFKDKW